MRLLEARLLDDDHVEIALTLPAGHVLDVAEMVERRTDQMADTQALGRARSPVQEFRVPPVRHP